MTNNLGPLAVDLTATNGTVTITAGGKVLAAVYDFNMRGKRRPDAERLALCWNACLSMSDAELRQRASVAVITTTKGKK